MSTVAQIALGRYGCAAVLSAPYAVRLVLERGQVCRLARRVRQVAVLSGTAWIAAGGRDYLLQSGERCRLPPSRDALLSGLGDQPLTVDLQA